MTFSRTPWIGEFTKASRLLWRCPGCVHSLLTLDKATLHEGETGASLAAHDELAWEPEWIDGRFSGLLRCPNCQAAVAVVGTFRIKDERSYHPVEGEIGDYVHYYTPRYFADAPHILPLNDRWPEAVREDLLRSFALYWSDPDACANRIRGAVEHLLTSQGVRRTTVATRGGRAGRRERLSLHARIEAFAGTRPALADALMAVKWIGNAGSHAGAITQDALLDGYELLAFALDELYVRRTERVASLSRSINRRKGPRRSRPA